MSEAENKLEKTLKVLANKRRLAILKFLKKHDEAPVSDIADTIKLSFTATSKHLNMLFGLGIVEREQRGLQMFYKLSRNQEKAVKYILLLL